MTEVVVEAAYAGTMDRQRVVVAITATATRMMARSASRILRVVLSGFALMWC